MTQQEVRQGIPALLPGIVGEHQRWHLIDPRHFDRGAAVEDNDGALVRTGHSADELVLRPREPHMRPVPALALKAAWHAGKDDGDIGLCRQFRSALGPLVRLGGVGKLYIEDAPPDVSGMHIVDADRDIATGLELVVHDLARIDPAAGRLGIALYFGDELLAEVEAAGTTGCQAEGIAAAFRNGERALPADREGVARDLGGQLKVPEAELGVKARCSRCPSELWVVEIGPPQTLALSLCGGEVIGPEGGQLDIVVTPLLVQHLHARAEGGS